MAVFGKMCLVFFNKKKESVRSWSELHYDWLSALCSLWVKSLFSLGYSGGASIRPVGGLEGKTLLLGLMGPRKWRVGATGKEDWR
jgi:hypothetical protein